MQCQYDDFAKKYLAGQDQIIWQEITADCTTPVALYLKYGYDKPYSFLLESVERAKNRARYSIIGFDPDYIYTTGNAKTAHISLNNKIIKESANARILLEEFIKQTQLDIPPFLPGAASGIFGYLSYNAVTMFESKIPDTKPAQIDLPAGVYFRPTTIIIIDNLNDKAIFIKVVVHDKATAPIHAWNMAQNNLNQLINKPNISHPYPKNIDESPLPLKPLMQPAEYEEKVRKAQEYIKAGDIFQVVLSQRAVIEGFNHHPFAYYRSLRMVNPSPYMFYMQFDGFHVMGASPETLVKCQNGVVTIRPIAGTRKRGANTAEDEALAQDLLSDEKELAEHLMLLDLGRNDVGRCAQLGSVVVREQFMVEKYSHVMHIVSQVEGQLAKGQTALTALMAGMPAGTVSGAPKIRAMQIIDELEPIKREIYAGAVGYFSANGDMDHCIALRTAVYKNGQLYLQAGAGVVYDSVPQMEHQECINKMRALMVAAQNAYKFGS